MHRQRTGKRLEITRRDIAIFQWLARYRYLNSNYLHAFVGGASLTRFKERLGHLFHEGFIDRPAQQWQLAEARCRPVVYELGEGARRALAEYRFPLDDRRDILSKNAHRQFSHAVLICACLASLELGTLSQPGVRFIPWAEILDRAPSSTQASNLPFRIPGPNSTALIPDGLFGLEYDTGGRTSYRFFAMEIDRGTMPVTRSIDSQTSYLAKLVAYREIIERQIHRAHLGVPNFLVLTVTTNEDRVLKMMRAFEQVGGNTAMLFRSLESSGNALISPSPDFLCSDWKRCSGSALSIASV
jgi:hypothetical protein